MCGGTFRLWNMSSVVEKESPLDFFFSQSHRALARNLITSDNAWTGFDPNNNFKKSPICGLTIGAQRYLNQETILKESGAEFAQHPCGQCLPPSGLYTIYPRVEFRTGAWRDDRGVQFPRGAAAARAVRLIHPIQFWPLTLAAEIK